MKKNIVLIGMPGSGQSTIGVLLAKAINYQFIDGDLLIQRQEKDIGRYYQREGYRCISCD